MSPSVRLADLCLRFARVERATHHPDGVRPETDADHTIMLAVFACATAERLNACAQAGASDWGTYLDIGLVAQFALVHDFPEVYAGDINTLLPFDANKKAAKETAAKARIHDEFIDPFPWLPVTIWRYTRQQSPEARLVRYLDKFVVKFAHTLNGGASLRKLGVGLEPLKERHRLQIDELAEEYPELAPVLREACDEAEAAYAAALARCPL